MESVQVHFLCPKKDHISSVARAWYVRNYWANFDALADLSMSNHYKQIPNSSTCHTFSSRYGRILLHPSIFRGRQVELRLRMRFNRTLFILFCTVNKKISPNWIKKNSKNIQSTWNLVNIPKDILIVDCACKKLCITPTKWSPKEEVCVKWKYNRVLAPCANWESEFLFVDHPCETMPIRIYLEINPDLSGNQSGSIWKSIRIYLEINLDLSGNQSGSIWKSIRIYMDFCPSTDPDFLIFFNR
jgi:hypothetical protein